MASLPLSPTKVWEAWNEASHAADVAVFIVMVGDAGLMARADEVIAGGGTPLRRSSLALDQLESAQLGSADLLLALVQPQDEDRLVPGLRRSSRPLGAVVIVDDGPAATYEITWYEPDLLRVSFADDEQGWEVVLKAIVDRAEEHLVPMGRRYLGLRSRAAQKMIQRTARQNAVIGAAFFVPGTDMPLMTLNQAKMVMGLAALYGFELNQDRVIELLGVVGLGFALRTAARQIVDLIPGPGMAIKAAIGFSGTLAMGEAALKYFEEGAPATPSRLARVVKRIRG
jgi:uncharacterized protein (DUF697 family)